MYIYYNDELKSEGRLTHSCEGFQYGFGVFETMLVADSIPLFINEHYKRLKKSCSKLSINLALNEAAIQTQAMKLAELNNIEQGRLKLICFRDEEKASYIMTLEPYSYEKVFPNKGLNLAVSRIKRNPHSPLCYIKSLNYMESILAKNEAMQKGYDEALLLNVYDKIAEGSVTNIFWVRESIVYTPHLECGILEGIIRSKVLEICDSLGLQYREGSYELQELLQADEVFVTNSLKGIAPVSLLENRSYSISEYITTKQIHQEYNKMLIEAANRINP